MLEETMAKMGPDNGEGETGDKRFSYTLIADGQVKGLY